MTPTEEKKISFLDTDRAAESELLRCTPSDVIAKSLTETPDQTDSKGPAVFSMVFLPTLTCNCQCTHCFENLSATSMDADQFLPVFGQMRQLAALIGCKTLRVYWQGGEVFCMCPDSVQKALDAAHAAFEGSGVKLEHHLQTNLLLYDSGRWKKTVKKFASGTISSSLDYPNLYRTAGKLSGEDYNRRWLEKKAEAEADGFRVSLISVPNPHSLKLGARQFYSYYRDTVQVDHLQVNFPFPGTGKGLEALDLDELSKFMVDLYMVWTQSGEVLNLSPFLSMRERLARNTGILPCPWGESCARSLIAVGPTGIVSQCDCWLATYEDYGFGVLGKDSVSEILTSENRKIFQRRPYILAQHTECGECKYWGICYGGCAVRSYAFSGQFYGPDHYCQVYKSMFSALWQHVFTPLAGRDAKAPVTGGEDHG